ncbi:MAG: branched-chain amino acid ABC transporter permease [Chloroflexi bacterium]|nr:MAG: branched-chain amino acid ABC transporter permease [Phototrophicales bacterium]RMF78765.1 MAG: branched-chain amino acid ABC transporter permease [Chloroflexota bacterium]
MSRQQQGMVLLAVISVILLILPQTNLLGNNYRVTLIRDGFFYAILASSWALLAGVSGQFSFGHMAFMAIGAYTAGILGRDGVAIIGLAGGEIHPLMTIIAGTIMAGFVGFIIGVLLLRLRAAYLALFTIAFSELIRIGLITEFQFTGGSNGLEFRPLFASTSARLDYYIMFVLLVVSLAVMYSLSNSRFGMFLRAIREDEEAAAAMGVDIVRYKVLIFVITSAIVGLAGGVFYHQVGIITPNSIVLLQMSLVIAYAVIGGMESLLGATVGAFVSRIVIELLREIPIGTTITIGDFSLGPTIEPGAWRFALFGLIMIITLRFARNGLLYAIIQWFSERHVAIEQTVSKRVTDPAPEEVAS